MPCIPENTKTAVKSVFWTILFICFVLCQSVTAQVIRSFSLPSGVTPADYIDDIVVIKLKDNANSPQKRSLPVNSSAALDKIRQMTVPKDIELVFPEQSPVKSRQGNARQSGSGSLLNSIYKLYLPDEIDLVETINQLLQMEEVVYAEPYYLMQPLAAGLEKDMAFTPNDPEALPGTGRQDYLSVVRAYDAWHIEKGDSSVIIGILDTGVDQGHQDLIGNLYYNQQDPPNGADDDGDGYIDNYSGWDMADQDNDPTADKSQHGTMVTGIAAATTGNGKGIAGAGFRSSFMPVKVFRSSDNIFRRGYEAIAYAADKGCKVINLSWGGANAYSFFGQDMINYAVLEKDVVIVAAAGNSGKHENFYPASYDNVLSVAISDTKDNRISPTTYGYFVDLMAPGYYSYTTSNENSYRTGSGSSLSAPLVSGAAALVRAKYPELSALQVMEKLRLSADDVYSVGSNGDYAEQLGYGRLNMARALQDLNSPALRMTSFSYENHMGAYALRGDTLQIKMSFTNYFRPASAQATVTLTSLSPYVTLIDSVFQIGMVDSLQKVYNHENPFRVYLHEDLPVNEKLVFRLGFEDENYADYQYFTFYSSPDHINISNGAMQLTVGANGNIAFNPYELKGGKGMLYQHNPVARQMGLIIAAGADKVSDNVVIDFNRGSRSKDFATLEGSRFFSSKVADLQFGSAFSDELAANPLGLRIEQTWLADTSTGSEKFFITEYRISSLKAEAITDLHVGIFSDWNLGDQVDNHADWDSTYHLGYAYNGILYTGVSLLTAHSPAYYAIDLKALNGNLADVGNSFTDEERYKFLSGSVAKTQAGVNGTGNDVACLIGASTDSVLQYQTKKYAFALVAGKSLAELQKAAMAAQARYSEYLANPPVSETIFVCHGSTAGIAPEDGNLFRFYSDPQGTRILHEGSEFTTWPVTADTVVYIANIDNGYEGKIRQIDVRLLEPVAAFSFNGNTNRGVVNDTLFLDESENYVVELADESINAVEWQWDLGNGFKSMLQNPKTRYVEAGTYTLTLQVHNAAGCQDIYTRTLTVVERAPAPQMEDQQVCAGSGATLKALNADDLKFYADVSLKQLIHRGAAYTSSAIHLDTVFYVVNAGGQYESLPEKVKVIVISSELDIAYRLDTADVAAKYKMDIQAVGDVSKAQSIHWYVDDILIGKGDRIQYNFTAQHNAGKTFTIRMDYTFDSAGKLCDFSTSKTLTPVATDKPAFAITHICRNEKVIISPLEGDIFYFYKDKSLDRPIYKGKALVVDEALGTHTYYVTRMDSLRESYAAEVTVAVNRFVDFRLSTDTLYLSENNKVSLKGFTLDNSDPGQVSWNWSLGGGQMMVRPASFTQQFDTAGVYNIRLTAYTADGCTNTIEKELVVRNVAATNTELIDAALLLHPNPSSGLITIENPHWQYENLSLRLLSLQGKVLFFRNLVYQSTPVTLNLQENFSGLQEGIYLLQIESRFGMSFRKIVIRP